MEKEKPKGLWFCPKCDIYIEPEEVTYEETHQHCGEPAEWRAENRKYKTCANCGCELGEEFYMYRDNFLQVKYFEAEDGSDNAFCSETCAAESLMLESVDNVTEE